MCVSGKPWSFPRQVILQRFDLTDTADWDSVGNQTPEYKELFAYLGNTTQRAIEATYPKKEAGDLLKEMQTDVQLTYRHLCLTDNSDNIYYRTPILASLEPDTFVAALLNLPPDNTR